MVDEEIVTLVMCKAEQQEANQQAVWFLLIALVLFHWITVRDWACIAVSRDEVSDQSKLACGHQRHPTGLTPDTDSYFKDQFLFDGWSSRRGQFDLDRTRLTFRVTQMTLRASLICGCWVPWANSSHSQIPRLHKATHLGRSTVETNGHAHTEVDILWLAGSEQKQEWSDWAVSLRLLRL